MPRGKQVSAAIYLRISLDASGDGLAIERQRQDCEALARARGWKVVETYVDQSISAYDRRKRRPAYDRLVEDYAAGRFQALICWDLDRLTRQPRQLEDWIEAAEERGLLLVTANGEADLATDGGRMYARIKAAVSRSEMERKSARQRRAGQQRAELGRVPSGVRALGYELDGRVIASEARIVRSMFDRFLAGESLRGLSRDLTERDVATRSGRPWNPSSVRSVLTNSRYAGLRSYATRGPDGARMRSVVGRGEWKPLIDEDTWRLVQAKLADPRRATNRVGTDRKHLGSGIYLCHQCSQRMTSWTGKRYSCRDCGITRSMPPVDEAVLTAVEARLADPRIGAQMTPGRAGQGEALRDKASELRRRLDRIDQDYDDGTIDGARYRSATGKVQAELEAVLAEQAQLLGAGMATGVLASVDPVAAFRAESLMVRRAVVDALVEVRLLRGRRGTKNWDPESVVIKPRALRN